MMEAPTGQPKNPIEALTREELLQKYKGLLGIAKKAKQAKDELAEENRKLKESLVRCETQRDADKKSLLTMKEMVEEFTEQKLLLATQLSEIKMKSQTDEEILSQLRIENESLKRQLEHLNEDNESLLKDMDRMDDQLKQVNMLGLEQKTHLSLLEREVNKLKEAESLNSTLQSTIAVTQEENKTLKEQENNTKQALEELLRKYSHVKEINTYQRHKFNALKDRFVEVHRKLKNLKECKRVLLETQHEYAEAVSTWQNEIVKASRLLFNEINTLRSQNEQLKQKLKSRDEIIDTSNGKGLGLDVESMAERLQEMHALTDAINKEKQARENRLCELEKQNERLTKEIEAINSGTEGKHFRNVSMDVNISSQDYKEKLELYYKKNEDLCMENDTLKKSIDALKKKIACLEEQNCQIEILKTEKQSLQAENNKMNEQITELISVRNDLQQIRDVIRGLEEEKVCLLAQLKAQQQHEKDVQINNEELQCRYAQKEREHADLLSEMRELNEALKARGDLISRQQEKQQELINELRRTNSILMQTEEEIKQKDEQLAQKGNQMTEKSRKTEIICTKESDATSTNNEEKIRSLNDLRSNADTQSEVMSTSTISRADEAARLREVDESLEDKYNKLRSLAVKLKKKIQDQAAEMEQQQSRYAILKHELEENGKQISQMQKIQDDTQKHIDTLKAENSKLKSSRKQTNVLNLEIEAAEKSLREVSSKLSAKSNELEALNEVLSSKEHTIKQLRKEISIVESAKQAECAHAKELKEQVDLLQEKLKDAIHEKQEAQTTKKELGQSQRVLQTELEEMRQQVALCANQTDTALSAAEKEKEHIKLKLIETEGKLGDTQKQVNNVERTLEDLRMEYHEYKVKAQAVLRKNQNKDTTRERELEEELMQLRTREQQARSKVSLQADELAENQCLIEQLRENNESLQRLTQELTNTIDELRQKIEALTKENRLQLLSQQEALKAHRQQLDAMDAGHKRQLQDLEVKYSKQIEKLSAQQVPAAPLPPAIGANTVAPTNISNINPSDQSKIDFLLMEREDAEGSESEVAGSHYTAMRKISTGSRRSHHDFMPLEELLNVPMHTFSERVTTISGRSFGRKDSIDVNANGTAEVLHMELQETKEHLHKQESRVRHLTALLAENEQDLAKVTQMNDMLKEELRRQERSVEREQHMHNSEYLKNVIIKFLTLNSGDERVRLVPVINTILKLSRNETEVLNCVAKGQKIPGESHGRGWSFLPIWNSNGGSGNN